MSFLFENLEAYKQTLEFSNSLSEWLEQVKINPSLKDQILRASSSIALNIAEGTGRFTKGEKRNFYVMSRGSVYECVAVLQILKKQNRIQSEYYEKFYRNLEDLSKMLTSLINSLK
jgi:four helix bundle protein